VTSFTLRPDLSLLKEPRHSLDRGLIVPHSVRHSGGDRFSGYLTTLFQVQ